MAARRRLIGYWHVMAAAQRVSHSTLDSGPGDRQSGRPFLPRLICDERRTAILCHVERWRISVECDGGGRVRDLQMRQLGRMRLAVSIDKRGLHPCSPSASLPGQPSLTLPILACHAFPGSSFVAVEEVGPAILLTWQKPCMSKHSAYCCDPLLLVL
jgi:hypothetical protein